MATQSSKIENMRNLPARGSEKLMKAWKARTLTDESVREIADALDKSPAKLENFNIVGGENATGIEVSLRYDGDDGPWCGNDIQFWLQWLLKHGSHGVVVTPPHIIINGTPWPEVITVKLNFGQTGPTETGGALPGVTGGEVSGG